MKNKKLNLKIKMRRPGHIDGCYIFMFVSMIVVSGAYTVSYKESKSSRDFGTSKKVFYGGIGIGRFVV